MSKYVYRLDYLRQTLFLHHDRRHVNGCHDCQLSRPQCGQVCLEGGTRKHVGAIRKYSWFKIIIRWFRHLITGKYTK